MRAVLRAENKDLFLAVLLTSRITFDSYFISLALFLHL